LIRNKKRSLSDKATPLGMLGLIKSILLASYAARLTVKTLTDKKKLKNKIIISLLLRHCFRLKLLHNNRPNGVEIKLFANQSQT
jgi:hypothetical protein